MNLTIGQTDKGEATLFAELPKPEGTLAPDQIAMQKRLITKAQSFSPGYVSEDDNLIIELNSPVIKEVERLDPNQNNKNQKNSQKSNSRTPKNILELIETKPKLVRALTLTKKNEYGEDKANEKGNKQHLTVKNNQRTPMGRLSGFTTAFE